MPKTITKQVSDQATNGAHRGTFVIQMTHKRPRNDTDPATNGHTKLKIRGTRSETTAKRRLFNRFPVPHTMWDKLGTAWDKRDAGQHAPVQTKLFALTFSINYHSAIQ
jgi:hypothetical protein